MVCSSPVARAAGLVAAAVLALPTVPEARGTDAREQARRYEKKGKRAYKKGRWDDAIAAFELAWQTAPQPRYLFNIGRCHEMKGDLPLAVEYLERYVAGEQDAQEQKDGEERLNILRIRLRKTMRELRVVSTPPLASVRLTSGKEEFSGSTPLSRWVAPGVACDPEGPPLACPDLDLRYKQGLAPCGEGCVPDAAACLPWEACGDGRRQPWEECDPALLAEQPCERFRRGWTGGLARCLPDCTVDASGCVAPAEGGAEPPFEPADGRLRPAEAVFPFDSVCHEAGVRTLYGDTHEIGVRVDLLHVQPDEAGAGVQASREQVEAANAVLADLGVRLVVADVVAVEAAEVDADDPDGWALRRLRRARRERPDRLPVLWAPVGPTTLPSAAGLVVRADAPAWLQGAALAHAFGHLAGLADTHACPGGVVETEVWCADWGDGLCETPYDPGGAGAAGTCREAGRTEEVCEAAPEGCGVVCTEGAAPQAANAMSGYVRDGCPESFSPAQAAVVRCVLRQEQRAVTFPVCAEGGEPAPEVCNGVDDDCDGATDERAFCPVPEGDDGLEDNDGFGEAADVTAGLPPELVVQAGDEDWFLADVQARSRLVVRADFDHGAGDVDLQLFDAAGVEVDRSESGADLELVRAETGAQAERFRLRVRLDAGARNAYRLTVAVRPLACLDRDGDGWGRHCAPGPDCDDGDEAVHPDAAEACNGRDDDCDGEVDDGLGVGVACWAGDGACLVEGVTVCAEGGGGVVCAAEEGVGSEETCNGVDDDCDGATDEECGCGAVAVCPPHPRGWAVACNVRDHCEYTPADDPLAAEIWVPAGEFPMGSPDGELGRRLTEGPVRDVAFERGFFVGRHEVTAARYEGCVAEGACSAAPDVDDPWGTNHRSNLRDLHPQNALSWGQAAAFCAWTGGRLPSEAEWERAATGPVHRLWPWGDAPPADCDHAVFQPDEAGCGVEGTRPVGSRPPGASAVGALDMAGNVWEWVVDCWHPDYEEAPATGRAWSTGCGGGGRMIRGGAFTHSTEHMRTATRADNDPAAHRVWVGVRCVRACHDWDGDGYDTCAAGDPLDNDGLGADCDDLAAGRHPAVAGEVCDGANDDCNGDVDDECGCGGVERCPGHPEGWPVLCNVRDHCEYTPADDPLAAEVWVPPGSFPMGEDDHASRLPVHDVTLSRGFLIGKYEVTVPQHEACEAEGWCTTPVPDGDPTGWGLNRSAIGREHHPQNGLGWPQARTYCGFAGGRLPTEAEWEYAATGSVHHVYPWGDEPEPHCWNGGNAVINEAGDQVAGWGCGNGGTWQAGAMPAGTSVRGLLNLGGNVWEWVEDCYHPGYDGAPADGSAWTADCPTVQRVLRGGTLAGGGDLSRVSSRQWGGPGASTAAGRTDMGVRCVRACDDRDHDGADTCDADDPLDEDGLPPDCDDADPAVRPGAPERYNGIDDDCDGSTEEEVSCGGVACPYHPEAWPVACNEQEHCEYTPEDDPLRAEVWVPPGTFPMGSPEGEPGRSPGEGPVHDVTFERGFLIGKHPVTVAVHEACEADEACGTPSVGDWDGEGWGTNRSPERADHPQNGLRKFAADDVCAWLGGRLPTEAEWEYAASGPSHRPYPWGDGPADCDHAAFDAGGGLGCGEGGTWPVDDLAAGASAAGVLHLAGNVEEWVEDCWHSSYAGAPDDGSPWVTDCEGDDGREVTRGGSFRSVGTAVRVAARPWRNPHARVANYGARCVRACDDRDGDGQDTCDAAHPLDSDGRSADCDDADPARHLGAAERYNGLDDDCDGVAEPEVACGRVICPYHPEAWPVGCNVREHCEYTPADDPLAAEVWVPPGVMPMGSPLAEGGPADERPVHDVTFESFPTSSGPSRRAEAPRCQGAS